MLSRTAEEHLVPKASERLLVWDRWLLLVPLSLEILCYYDLDFVLCVVFCVSVNKSHWLGGFYGVFVYDLLGSVVGLLFAPVGPSKGREYILRV